MGDGCFSYADDYFSCTDIKVNFDEVVVLEIQNAKREHSAMYLYWQRR